MRLLFIFIDGVGLGKENQDNPFFLTDTPGISKILEGRQLTINSASYSGALATLKGLDATLGIPGLPQSATGQASIFTGVNAASYIGKHLNGFPDQKLRRLLATKGFFRQLKSNGYRVIFANAYRPPFFDLLRRGLPGNRYSCSTLITHYGRLPFYDLIDLEMGRALYMDITNDILKRMGFEVALISPEEAAERLLKISSNYDFCLFEYFLSDLAGHMADRSEASRIVSILDRFIGRLSDLVNPRESMIIITSDHGNLEDLSSGDHTYNQVPALLIGNPELRTVLHPGLFDLTGFLPMIETALKWQHSEN